MKKLLLIVLIAIVGCVTIPRNEQIRQFCADPANDCVEAMREGETLRTKDYKTTMTTTEYDQMVDKQLEDYCKKYPWRCKDLKWSPAEIVFPLYKQPDRPDVATNRPDPPSEPDREEDETK